MTKKESPSNSDALAFSKKDQLGRSGSVPDRADLPFSKKQQADTAPSRPPTADLPFSKQQQMGKSPGATRPSPPTITRQRPSLSLQGPAVLHPLQHQQSSTMAQCVSRLEHAFRPPLDQQ